MSGPCDWPVSYAACATQPSEDVRAAAETMAVDFLWNWTGRVLGPCPVVLRPCRADCGGGTWRAYPVGSLPGVADWYPALVDGRWRTLSCGTCRTASCTCKDGPASLKLPGPVASVTEVVIDGVVLEPAAYQLEGDVLVRRDGEVWPACQDLDALPGVPGTWTVTYLMGVEVPEGGRVAAGVLAVELAKAMCNDASCKLPKRVQTITRQDVSMTFMDAFEDLDKGRTGLWLVDSWVTSMTEPPRGGRVYSVDVPRKRHVGL